MKSTLLVALFWAATIYATKAQVAIGSTAPPAEGALLQLTEGEARLSNANSTKGMLLPRVNLQTYTSLKMGATADPLTGLEKEHTGLIVYNINSDFDKCNLQSIPPGIHIWNGAKWDGLQVDGHIEYNQPPVTGALYQPNSFLVVSDGTAAAATTINIPVEKAFAVWDFLTSGDGGKLLASRPFQGNLSTSILWQEGRGDNNIVGTPTLNSNDIDRTSVISVPVTGIKGNAVIALSDTEGIRWSWHIWVTDNPTSANLSNNNGQRTYEWMDRNLGATSATPGDDKTIGLFYQWGRKDPMPGYISFAGAMTGIPTLALAKEIATAGVLSADGNGQMNSLAYTIANPLAHIFTIGTGDWFSQSSNEWQDRWERIQKDDCYTYSLRTAFDPCPKGWRVPPWSVPDERFSPWYLPSQGINTDVVNFSDHSTAWSTNKGHLFDRSTYNIGYYPMSGWRVSNTQNFSSINVSAFNWSATFFPINRGATSYLTSRSFFHSNKGATTAAGAQVRCVREEQ